MKKRKGPTPVNVPPPRARVARVLDRLAGRYPTTMLGSFAGRLTAFQILIGTILSARSRDESTEKVCVALFRDYPTPAALARVRPRALEPRLHAIGFYRQKARHIVATARRVVERHGGEVPRSLAELLEFPGVGRKVANCVLVYAFGQEAIPVDTHVHRVANRLGWVRTRTPAETEAALAAFLPRRRWRSINEIFVAHGKAVCRPIGPRCPECPVAAWCERRGVAPRSGAAHGAQTGQPGGEGA